MSALTQKRGRKLEKFQSIPLPLASGAGMKATQGGMACVDQSTGTAKPGAAGNANLLRVGVWAESVDNTLGAATTYALVDLDYEIYGQWFDNITGASAVVAANLFQDVYMADDHTITNSSNSGANSKAGRAWRLSPSGTEVLVEAYTL